MAFRRRPGGLPYPVNLLAGIGASLALMPPGVQISASAPAIIRPVTVDLPVRPLSLGINPNPRAAWIDSSAPQIKYQVQLEANLGSPRALGINPNPSARQLTESAPAASAALWLWDSQNLLATTLAAPTTPSITIAQLFASAPAALYQVQSDFYQNALPLNTPTPAVIPTAPPTGALLPGKLTGDDAPKVNQGAHDYIRRIPPPQPIVVSPFLTSRAPDILEAAPAAAAVAKTSASETPAMVEAVGAATAEPTLSEADREALLLLLATLL